MVVICVCNWMEDNRRVTLVSCALLMSSIFLIWLALPLNIRRVGDRLVAEVGKPHGKFLLIDASCWCACTNAAWWSIVHKILIHIFSREYEHRWNILPCCRHTTNDDDCFTSFATCNVPDILLTTFSHFVWLLNNCVTTLIIIKYIFKWKCRLSVREDRTFENFIQESPLANAK